MLCHNVAVPWLYANSSVSATLFIRCRLLLSSRYICFPPSRHVVRIPDFHHPLSVNPSQQTITVSGLLILDLLIPIAWWTPTANCAVTAKRCTSNVLLHGHRITRYRLLSSNDSSIVATFLMWHIYEVLKILNKRVEFWQHRVFSSAVSRFLPRPKSGHHEDKTLDFAISARLLRVIQICIEALQQFSFTF